MAGNQGFASMDADKQKEIAKKGGKASGGSNRSASSATNKRGGNLTTEDRSRGGKNSNRN